MQKMLIQETIERLYHDATHLQFPQKAERKLNVEEYQEFLEALYNRLDSLELRLNHLNLLACDTTALEGLLAFTQVKLPIKELELNIDTQEPSDFLNKLELSLVALAQKQVETVTLTDPQGVLSQEDYQKLAVFISQNPVSVQVNLPPDYRCTELQKQIDEAVAGHKLAKNIKNLPIDTAALMRSISQKDPRISRVNVPKDVFLDVELAQEEEVELAVAVEQDIAQENQVAGQPAVGWTLEDFLNALPQNLNLPPQAWLLTRTELIKCWHRWLNNIVLMPTKELQEFEDKGTQDRRSIVSLKEEQYLELSDNAGPIEVILNDPESNSKTKLKRVPRQWRINALEYETQNPETAQGVEIYPNPLANKISPQAANYLLHHLDQFKEGFHLHPNSLPSGFKIVNGILHYQEHYTPSQKIKKILTDQQVRHLIESTEPEKSAFLEKLWEKINQLPYQREIYAAFCTHLPKLLGFPLPLLEQLTRICSTGEHEFNTELLTLLLTHYESISKLFDKPQEDERETTLARARLAAFVHPNQTAEDLINTAQHMKAAQKISSKHILEQVLKPENSTSQKLKECGRQLQFNEASWDSLLNLYLEYAEEGLIRLMDKWQSLDPILLEHLQKTLFQNHHDMSLWINNTADAKKFQESLFLLEGLQNSPLEFEWWNILLEEHCKHHDNIDIAALFECFIKFSQKIKELNLEFYAADTSIYADSLRHIKDLPSTLERILSILKSCKEEDRQIQWSAIRAISLNASDSIRAFDSPLPCSFILPEMNLTANTYRQNRGYGLPKASLEPITLKLENIQEVDDPQFEIRKLPFYNNKIPEGCDRCYFEQLKNLTIDLNDYPYCFFYHNLLGRENRRGASFETKASLCLGAQAIKNLVWTKERFYRFLAAQPSRYPLAYYIDLQNEITKANLNPKIETLIYEVLAIGTTGRNAQFYNVKTAKQIGLNLIQLFKNNRNPEPEFFFRGYNSQVEYWGLSFNLPLHCIWAVIYWDLTDILLGDQTKNRHDQLAKTLSALNDDQQILFFKSLKFYDVDFFRQNIDALRQHIEIAKKLIPEEKSRCAGSLGYPETMGNKEIAIPRDQGGGILVTLMSHFNLIRMNEVEIQELITLFQHAFQISPKIINALELFWFMSADGSKLHPQNLMQFLNQFIVLEPLDEDNISRLIEQQFKAHFPDTFFENLRAPGLPLSQIKNDQERQLLTQLLLSDTGLGSNLYYEEVVSTLQDIKHQMDSKEYLNILKVLRHPSLNTNSIQSLLGLLKTIQMNKPFDFLFFVNTAHLLYPNQCQDLIAKGSCYLSKILPHFAQWSSQHYSRTDVQQTLIPLILILDEETLHSQPEVPRTHQALYLALQKELTDSISAGMPSQQLKNSLEQFFNHIQGRNDVGILESLNQTFRGNQEVSLEKMHEALDELNAILSFSGVASELVEIISATVNKYPEAKTELSQYLSSFLKSSAPDEEFSISEAWVAIHTLGKEFLALEDVDLVRALCTHCSLNNSAYEPHELLTLMNHPSYKALAQEERRFFLQILSNLANDKKACRLEELITLMEESQNNPQLLASLKSLYQSAPLPPVALVLSWKEQVAPEDVPAALEKAGAAFSLRPCEREAENGFDLHFALEQAAKMKGIVLNEGETLEQELETLDEAIHAVRHLSLQELKDRLKPDLDTATLLATMAELLYRTKGMPAKKDKDGNPILGRSFEIHTTQYLALYFMLKSGHVTAEIGTGEGKSRILMLLAGCQFVRGNTVDFVTKDEPLAKRDYLTFKSFFKAIGAKPKLLNQASKASDYELKGINFWSTAVLNLKRNQAMAEGQVHGFQEPSPELRSLLLDESDVVFYDLASSRFNFSMSSQNGSTQVPWIYDVLIEFYSQKHNLNLFHQNPQQCEAAFELFIKTKLNEEALKAWIKQSSIQRQTWANSAITALGLRFNHDFFLTNNRVQQTSQGPKLVSQIKLIVGNRNDERSKYSFGVYQCLQARLNYLKNQEANFEQEDPELMQALGQCTHDFFIETEKQIVYSSTTKTMLNHYVQGHIYTTSGTTGSELEQEEAKTLYQKAGQPMQFIQVPRHKGLHREDLPFYLKANEKGYFAQIREEIAKVEKTGQPILIFCKDDAQSKRLYEHLDKYYPESLRRICVQTPADEEELFVEQQAGQPAQVMVSTPMLGRGTDFMLSEETKDLGFKVLVTFLPTSRELLQMQGRAGRFGAPGSSRMILNKETLREQLGQKKLSTDLYTATDSYIRRQQDIMARKAQIERLIKFALSDFKDQFTENYFHDLVSKTDKLQAPFLIQAWQNFHDICDKKWANTWLCIKDNMDSPVNPSLEPINNYLSVYQEEVTQEWEQLKSTLKHHFEEEAEVENLDCLITKEQIRPLKLSSDLIQPFKERMLRVLVADKYDPAHDGKAVIYTQSFAKTRAFFRGERNLFADIISWWKGEGILFANLIALLKGQMTLKEYLFGASRPKSTKASLQFFKEPPEEENRQEDFLLRPMMT